MERITCGGFGAHEWWEKNKRRCENIGAEAWCDHCHKDMAVNSGWIVNWNWSNDSLYPISHPVFEYRLLGNECIKRFLTKDQYETYAIKQGYKGETK